MRKYTDYVRSTFKVLGEAVNALDSGTGSGSLLAHALITCAKLATIFIWIKITLLKDG